MTSVSGRGVGLIVETGVIVACTVGAGVVVVTTEIVGVREAEGVDSPKTLSPLLRTTNFRVTVTRLPKLSYPFMLTS